MFCGHQLALGLVSSIMSTSGLKNTNRVLYLQQIDIATTARTQIRIKLLVDGNSIDIHRNGQTFTWTPSRSLEIPSTCNLKIVVKAGHTVFGVPVGKMESQATIDGEEIADAFWDSKDPDLSMKREITFDGQPTTITLKFRPSATSESTHAALHRLQTAMKEFKPLRASSTQQRIEMWAKYGTALSEMNSYAKAAFGVVTATFELLKEQRKYDDMVSNLADGVERIIPFVRQIQEQALYSDAELMDGIIRKVYDLVLDVADFISGYVCRSAMKRTGKFIISTEDQRRITNLGEDLGELVVEFDRAVGFEALKSAKHTEEHILLRDRLKPVDAGHNVDRGCMAETRVGILEKITTWALQPLKIDTAQNNANMFWLYGIPGVGKTSIANSLCARLHNEKILGGSFFCRRDDPNLGSPKYVLPTLICRLAGVWHPYRKLVIDKLQSDSNLDINSANPTLFLELLEQLEKSPPHPLVLVIDALDECGEPHTRGTILRILIQASSQCTWLRIVVTSRQEKDIEVFFQKLNSRSLYASHDLAKDEKAQKDIEIFAQSKFSSVAAHSHLPNDWPRKSIFDKTMARAGGLFIYIDTVWRLIKDDPDPEETLIEIIGEGSGDALSDLYNLYSAAIKSRVGKNKNKFRRVIGVILAVASHRPLRDESVAILAGLEVRVVRTLVDGFNSLLYRDDSIKGGIRVRHLSIIDFFTSPHCSPELQIDMTQANGEVGLGCLNTMIHGLKFNICELETSLKANDEVEDLPSRIESKISDALQYSCLHWAKHLCFVPYPATTEMIEALDNFLEGVKSLYWIEVLSLLRQVTTGVRSLRLLRSWAKTSEQQFILHAKDVLMFLRHFHTPITTSAPHIYLSSLPFLPKESQIWKDVSNLFNKLMRVEKGRMETWPARPEIWLEHNDSIWCIACSPDGAHVVSGSYNGIIWMWDVETGRVVGESWKGHVSGINSIAYSPDGRHVISASGDITASGFGYTNCIIRKWDAETGRPIGKPWRGHTSWVNTVAYSPDGRRIVSGSQDKTIRIWDAETGEPVGEPWLGHTNDVLSVAYSPDCRYIVSASADSTIRKWNTETATVVGEPWKEHYDEVFSIIYSPDGHHVISGSKDGTIIMWDPETGKPIGEPWKGHTDSILSIAYSPDGQSVLSGSADKTIRVWDAKTGTPIGKAWEGHHNAVTSAIYVLNGQNVLSCSYDHTLRLWNVEAGGAVADQWEGHTASVKSIAYSPDGRHIVSGSEDKTIRKWEAGTGRQVGDPWKGHKGIVRSLAYSPDGRSVVSGSDDKTIQVWDADTGKRVGQQWKEFNTEVLTVAYSPDGRYIISGTRDNIIQTWDAETGNQIGEPWGPCRSSFAYSPDGRQVAFVSGDRVQVQNTYTREEVEPKWGSSADAIDHIAYSPDGRRIVTVSVYGVIKIWDLEIGKTVGDSLFGHDEVNSVALSPDGRYVASGSRDHTLEILDLLTRNAMRLVLRGHTAPVFQVVYSPDGRNIASASGDNTIRIWDVQSPRYEPRAILPPVQSKSESISTSSITVYLHPDENGWVHHPDGGLLFWVPVDCRNGLTCPAIITIPINGPNRAVRLNFTDFVYGTSWEAVKRSEG